ncbi:MAG: hypothetical protein V3R68_03680, partial [Gammaproteobacteria bacterium]
MMHNKDYEYPRKPKPCLAGTVTASVLWKFSDAFWMFVYACIIQLILLLSLSQVSYAEDNLYPGYLVDIGTHRLHIHCTGNKSPSVIIDSGLGGFSLEWWQIQKNLSSQIRICSYDRAGYGWSDPG